VLLPLIGRRHETAAVITLLHEPGVRLVTLTGPGGTGKTHLAFQVAADLVDNFPDGVWLVELAPIEDAALVPQAIAQALGIEESGGRSVVENLKTFLREKHLLLLLDNFEHVVAAAPLVSDLLAVAPLINVLVTSQSLLNLYGEHHFAVPPLEHPDPEHLPVLDLLTHYAAVELFIHRARAARHDFALTGANAAAVAGICAQLEGIPLAIELAAARVRIFSPQALLLRLDQRLTALTGGARDRPARQRSLRSTIDWSYHLLDPGEQTLFARLGVFVGGCSLPAAEEVCREQDALGAREVDDQVADGLVSLLDKSLLRQQDGADGEPRFMMLESIREYALERLAASGEADWIRERHAEYFLGWLDAMQARGLRGQPAELAGLLRVELPNIVATRQWILEHGEVPIVVRWHLATWTFASITMLGPGIERALERWYRAIEHDDQSMPSETRMQTLIYFGRLAHVQNDITQALTLLEEGLLLARAHDAPEALGDALINLGNVYRDQGWYDRAEPLYAEGLAHYQTLGQEELVAGAYHVMGELALLQGEYARVVTLAQAGLSLYRSIGLGWGIADTLINLGFAAWHQGDDTRAAGCFQESLSVARNLQDLPTIAVCLTGIAAVATSCGCDGQVGSRAMQRAARLLGAAAVIQEGTGVPMPHAHHREYESILAGVRAHLDQTTFATTWAEGQAMTLDQAIAYTLEGRCRMPDRAGMRGQASGTRAT
jgi:predicted ATPase